MQPEVDDDAMHSAQAAEYKGKHGRITESFEGNLDEQVESAKQTPLHVGLFATQALKMTNSNADHVLRGPWAYCFGLWFLVVNLGVFIGMMYYFMAVACPTGAVIISPQWGHAASTSSKVVKGNTVNTKDTLYPLEQGFHVCSTYVINPDTGEYSQPCLLGGISSCDAYSIHPTCPNAVPITFDDDAGASSQVTTFISSCQHTQNLFNNCTKNRPDVDDDLNQYYYSSNATDDDNPACVPFACSSYKSISVGYVQCASAEIAFSYASEYTGYAALFIYVFYYAVRVAYYKGIFSLLSVGTWRLILVSMVLHEAVNMHKEEEERKNSSHSHSGMHNHRSKNSGHGWPDPGNNSKSIPLSSLVKTV